MFWIKANNKPVKTHPIQYWVIGGYLKGESSRTYFISTKQDHGSCHECVDGPFDRASVMAALDFWRAVHDTRPSDHTKRVAEAVRQHEHPMFSTCRQEAMDDTEVVAT